MDIHFKKWIISFWPCEIDYKIQTETLQLFQHCVEEQTIVSFGKFCASVMSHLQRVEFTEGFRKGELRVALMAFRDTL